jgi:hypothetical protein
LEDGFPWYKDDSVLDRKDDAVEAYCFQHAARPGWSELTVPAATTKHIQRDVLSYPDAWYFAGGIAEFLLKRVFLFCSLLPELVGVGHGPPIGRLWVSYPLPGPFVPVRSHPRGSVAGTRAGA